MTSVLNKKLGLILLAGYITAVFFGFLHFGMMAHAEDNSRMGSDAPCPLDSSVCPIRGNIEEMIGHYFSLFSLFTTSLPLASNILASLTSAFLFGLINLFLLYRLLHLQFRGAKNYCRALFYRNYLMIRYLAVRTLRRWLALFEVSPANILQYQF